jgi:hypothetical protein
LEASKGSKGSKGVVHTLLNGFSGASWSKGELVHELVCRGGLELDWIFNRLPGELLRKMRVDESFQGDWVPDSTSSASFVLKVVAESARPLVNRRLSTLKHSIDIGVPDSLPRAFVSGSTAIRRRSWLALHPIMDESYGTLSWS